MRLEIDHGDGYEHLATFSKEQKGIMQGVVRTLNQKYDSDVRIKNK